jgi:transcriptional regulator with XRE-family HTH domain
MENTEKTPGALLFLDQLVKSQGVTHKQLAALIGVTPQRISYIFNKADDCFLSRACEIARSVGYDLKVNLVPNAGKIRTTEINLEGYRHNDVDVRINGKILVKRKPQSATRYPDYIQNCPTDSRLHFLAEFIKKENLLLYELAGSVGLSGSFFNYTFKNDDILVSILYRIAQAYGCDISWSLTRLPKTKA